MMFQIDYQEIVATNELLAFSSTPSDGDNHEQGGSESFHCIE
jgi:hypothetical protein